MALDPGISLQVGQGVTPPPNPLAMVGQFASTANALDQNRLINQYTANAQQQNVGMRQDQGQKSLLGTNQILAGLLNNPDLKAGKPITDQIIGSVLQAGQMGFLPPDAVKAALSNVPGDAAGQQAWLQGHYDQSEALLGRAGPNTFGTTGTVSNGRAVQPVVVAPARLGGGLTPAGGPITQYMSPADLATRTPVGYDTNGNPQYGPLGNVTPGALSGGAVAPAPLTGASGAVGDGRYPGVPQSLRNPNANLPLPPQVPPGAPAAGGPVPTVGGPAPDPTIVTAPGAARTAQLTTQGTQSAGAFQQIADQGVQARGQNAILGTMLADASQFAPGPGQDKVKAFKSAMVSWAPGIAKAFGVDPASVAANESFDKVAAQIQNAQGAGSDARLAVIQHANPSSSLTPAGIDLIVRGLQGNADYLQARAKLAASYPDQTNRAGFESSIGTNLDPRAFQLFRMTPDQRATYFNSVGSEADKTALKQAYIYAQTHGLFPGAGNAGP
ncbi:MAG TPA: hypothetical protein VN702_17600 [Acetobacteraceae bacterium]|nr:hypothetical protein [Acetobacteraceae bacterium]